jgi:hypothetical protein
MALLVQRRHALLRDQLAMETDQRAAEEARWSEEVGRLAKQQTLQSSPQVNDDARRRADEAREYDVMEARRAAHNLCLRSDVYQRYWAGTHVMQAMDQKSRAQQALADTTHPDAKDSALQSVARADDDIRKWWAVYRRYGGDGPGPEAVSQNTSDPCPSIQ